MSKRKRVRGKEVVHKLSSYIGYCEECGLWVADIRPQDVARLVSLTVQDYTEFLDKLSKFIDRHKDLLEKIMKPSVKVQVPVPPVPREAKEGLVKVLSDQELQEFYQTAQDHLHKVREDIDIIEEELRRRGLIKPKRVRPVGVE